MKIYVFETSESGFHNTRSARAAVEKCGAIKNQGFGLQGNSFGIPVLNRKNEPLSLTKILPYVRKFVLFAQMNPDYEFKVENIGIESVKYPKEWIAPLFVGVPDNVSFFDEELKELIQKPVYETRLLIISSRTFADVKKVFEITDKLTHFFDLKNIEMIPIIESLAGRLMNGYTKKHNIQTKLFKTPWDRLDVPTAVLKDNAKGRINAGAYYDKLAWAVAYGTDLLIFDDYKSKDMQTVIKHCSEGGYKSILCFGSVLDTQNQESGGFPSRTSV